MRAREFCSYRKKAPCLEPNSKTLLWRLSVSLNDKAQNQILGCFKLEEKVNATKVKSGVRILSKTLSSSMTIIWHFSGYNLTSPFSADVNSSVLTYHRIIEAFKFSYAWRSRLGDPDFNSQINEVNHLKKKRELRITLFAWLEVCH